MQLSSGRRLRCSSLIFLTDRKASGVIFAGIRIDMENRQKIYLWVGKRLSGMKSVPI